MRSEEEIENIEENESEFTPLEYDVQSYPADYTLEVLYNKWLNKEIIIPRGSSDPEKKINVFPQSVTIYLDDNSSIIWSNLDNAPSSFVADDQSWTTGIIKSGESISLGFNHTGVFNFHGEPHPWQKGTIIVK